MNHSDLSKFISKLNIAKRTHVKAIKVHRTKIILQLLAFFEELGLIRGFIIEKKQAVIKVYLKYKIAYVGAWINIKHVSLPSKRVYVDMLKLKKLKEKSSKCFYIISTKRGLLTDGECMRLKIGGEVLLKVVL